MASPTELKLRKDLADAIKMQDNAEKASEKAIADAAKEVTKERTKATKEKGFKDELLGYMDQIIAINTSGGPDFLPIIQRAKESKRLAELAKTTIGD